MGKLKKAIIIVAGILIAIVLSFVILFVSVSLADRYASNLNNDNMIYLRYSDERTLKYSDVDADGLYNFRIIVDNVKMLDQEFTVKDKDGTVIEKAGQYIENNKSYTSNNVISNNMYQLKKGQKIRIKFKAVSGCQVIFLREVEHKNIVFENAEETGLDAKIDTFEMKRYYKFTPTTTGSYTFASSGQSAITIYNTAHEKLKEVTTFPSSIRLVGGVEYRIELPAGSDMKIVKAAENVGE